MKKSIPHNPNALQQRTVDIFVKQYTKQFGLPTHKAFLYFVIEKFLEKLELTRIDIEEAIIDGSADGGIDAIVVDEETEESPRIYFFQAKYIDIDKEAFKKGFPTNAISKIKGALNDFVLQGKINNAYQNARLVDKLHTIKNILKSSNPRFTVVLCSNSKGISADGDAILKDFLEETNKIDEYIRIENIHLDRLATELLAPIQEQKIDISLQISGKYLTEDTGDVRLFVGAVEARSLADLVEKYGDPLFERNIRGYLRKSNPVNKNIVSTASGKQSPYFVYMNNGITITCSRFTHAPATNSPLLEITNAQIVNGQQTVRSLFGAQKEGVLKDDVKVLIRLVETSNDNLLMDIVEATNTQSKVTSRDLHSNDEIQKLIEKHLEVKGYFYEARQNKYRNKDSQKRIDALLAAQAYYAIFYEAPAIAKDKKKALFGEKYDEIFNEKLNPESILYSFRLLKIVQESNNDPKLSNKYTFLKDAALHTATLMHRLAISKGDQFVDLEDRKITNALYKKTILALASLVKERIRAEGDKYEHRRTFKDPETYGRAVELLLEK